MKELQTRGAVLCDDDKLPVDFAGDADRARKAYAALKARRDGRTAAELAYEYASGDEPSQFRIGAICKQDGVLATLVFQALGAKNRTEAVIKGSRLRLIDAGPR